MGQGSIGCQGHGIDKNRPCRASSPGEPPDAASSRGRVEVHEPSDGAARTTRKPLVSRSSDAQFQYGTLRAALMLRKAHELPCFAWHVCTRATRYMVAPHSTGVCNFTLPPAVACFARLEATPSADAVNKACDGVRRHLRLHPLSRRDQRLDCWRCRE